MSSINNNSSTSMEQIYEGHSIQCEAFAFTFVIGMPQYKFCLIWKCLNLKWKIEIQIFFVYNNIQKCLYFGKTIHLQLQAENTETKSTRPAQSIKECPWSADYSISCTKYISILFLQPTKKEKRTKQTHLTKCDKHGW